MIDVAMLDAAVRGRVFDPKVGQLEMVVVDVQVVGLGEGAPIGFERRVVRAIVAIEECLVVAFQFVVEDDAGHLDAVGVNASCFLREGAIDLGVVCKFSGFDDASVEGLLRTIAMRMALSLDDRLALRRQRHDALGAGDVGQGVAADQM